jgi:hypothetical protein
MLGVIPLAWSDSGIIRTVFVMFMAMITLGLAHGLILLPVVLSYMGPNGCIINQLGNEHCNTEETKSEQGKLSCTSRTESTAATMPMMTSTIEFDAHGENNDGLLVSPLGFAEKGRQPSFTAPQLSGISSTEHSV